MWWDIGLLHAFCGILYGAHMFKCAHIVQVYTRLFGEGDSTNISAHIDESKDRTQFIWWNQISACLRAGDLTAVFSVKELIVDAETQVRVHWWLFLGDCAGSPADHIWGWWTGIPPSAVLPVWLLSCFLGSIHQWNCSYLLLLRWPTVLFVVVVLFDSIFIVFVDSCFLEYRFCFSKSVVSVNTCHGSKDIAWHCRRLHIFTLHDTRKYIQIESHLVHWMISFTIE